MTMRVSQQGESRMESTPLVSIVIPVYNDAEVIAGAVESCLRQTLQAVEVIVVDDGSSDGTAEIVEQYAMRDARVRVIRQGQNLSAYQARRIGILEARAAHLLFLDGDDELAEVAAERSLARAVATGADLVQFGIDVVRNDGATGGGFEARLQPTQDGLTGTDVLRGLFPVDQPAQGQLWRFLFRTQVLADAYALMPDDLVIPRVNDLPITFLAAALATKYASMPDRLYRYHFGRGGSGQKVADLGWAKFYAGAIDAINTIAPAVDRISARSDESDFIVDTYQAARSSIIGYTTYYLAEHTAEHLLDATFQHLLTRAPARDIVKGTARFWPAALDTAARHLGVRHLGERAVRNVLLTTNIVRTGGVSGVLLSQARFLVQAGYSVTIAAREPGSDAAMVPPGVEFVEIDGPDLASKLDQWAELCRTREVDVVIEHHWLYTRTWPAFALAASAEGAATIGWAHNFAGRSLLLGLNSLDFQARHVSALSHLIVLSPLDVAFWKLRGMPRVSYLPNPPSPLLLESSAVAEPKHAPERRPIELIWWGRLEQRTKRVAELVLVAAELDRLGVDFRMRIVGPDWSGMSAEKLMALASEHGVADRVHAVGPLHGDELIAAIDSSDLFVNTSVIEGYPLTIPEAQSRGLPVAMYELPWLAVAEDNAGIVTSGQGDAAGLAMRIAEIAATPTMYDSLSRASIEAGRRELTYDFASLYEQLVNGELPASHSPSPTTDDIRRLVDLVVLFTEQNAKVRNAAAKRSAPSRRGRPAAGRRATPARSRTWRLVARVTPAAHVVLDMAPWLRPTAARVKHALLSR